MPAIILSAIKALTCLIFRATLQNFYDHPILHMRNWGTEIMELDRSTAKKRGSQGFKPRQSRFRIQALGHHTMVLANVLS